jgi:tRNA (guanine-N7-)-methyltransferase
VIKTTAGVTDKLAFDVLASPSAWDQIVPAGATIELEIGSGKGLFLQSAATERPQHFFLGIELAMKFANRAAERLTNSELANAKMLRGDAQVFLRDTVPTGSVTRMHVYFPDPWWRNKHKKRRVLNDQAILDIERSLIAKGEFHFWTDVLDYYELICAQVMDTTSLLGPKFIPERPASHGMDYTTHFERRARLNGQPIYRALFIKP